MAETLESYRDWVLKDEGGQLGVIKVTVDVDPDILDRDAARSVISAKLFDSENLSGAYGGHYVWSKRWSDSRRVEDRGYRVRFLAVYEPPESGSFRMQAFGYGETRSLPYNASAATLQAELRGIDEDLTDIAVAAHPRGLLITLPFRLGLGASDGRFLAQGGVGIALLNRDLTLPLRQGDECLLSPRIPFEDEDNIEGIHTCINLALADIVIPDMLPVVSAVPRYQRSEIVKMQDIAPWLNIEQVTGFYAPTDWLSITTFAPPVSGTYTFTLETAKTWGPNLTPLAYDASGAEIEAALSSIYGPFKFAVEPQGVASSYRIGWRTMHHNAVIVPSAGYVTDYTTERLRDPFPISISPHHQPDFEMGSLTDPGYAEDQSWFVAVRRKGHQRICPQVRQRRSDGRPLANGKPMLGKRWIESTTGLVNDLDQALPNAEAVAPAALRYCFLSLAAASPAGEEVQWLEKARRIASVSAARPIYGRVDPRPSTSGYSLAGMPKSTPFFMPDY